MAPTNEWTVEAAPAGASPLVERAAFLKKTYGHLLGAVMALVILELLLFRTGFPEAFARWALAGRMNWLVVMGAFMFVGFIAQRHALSNASVGAQYFGLGLYVVAQTLFLA